MGKDKGKNLEVARREDTMKVKERRLWEIIIENRRLTQWLLIGGGVTLSLIGLTTGKLNGEQVIALFSIMMAAVFGLKAVANNKGGEDDDS